MRGWTPATSDELAPARETPENMPALTRQLQRAALEIATLSPREFRERFPELQFMERKRTRYRSRRIAFARVLHVVAIHVDHEKQFVQWPTRQIAEESGMREGRTWRVLDDFRDSGYLTPGKQRKIEVPAAPGAGRRFKGCAVRRHCEPLFYRRLQVNVEADAEKARREKARADAAEQARADLEAQRIRELRQLPHIKTAPKPPPLAVIDDGAKAAAVRRIERQLSERAAAAAVAPARDPTGPPE